MGIKSKVTEQERETAVKRYSQGEPVVALAKQYKVSVPAIYQWIAQAKKDQTELVRRARMSPETVKLDKNINLDLLVKEQAQTIAALKARLLDLMTKYNEW